MQNIIYKIILVFFIFINNCYSFSGQIFTYDPNEEKKEVKEPYVFKSENCPVNYFDNLLEEKKVKIENIKAKYSKAVISLTLKNENINQEQLPLFTTYLINKMVQLDNELTKLSSNHSCYANLSKILFDIEIDANNIFKFSIGENLYNSLKMNQENEYNEFLQDKSYINNLCSEKEYDKVLEDKKIMDEYRYILDNFDIYYKQVSLTNDKNSSKKKLLKALDEYNYIKHNYLLDNNCLLRFDINLSLARRILLRANFAR